ncbi:PH domain-containing protein [Actinomycetospora cinnamomea]|uniref:PH (Pleckstrin Homology) domain-containing protein n=1 Tax=Actinomycetospora cinnamomea TaxID=663609 RepID=A0A2U1FHZ4_9PSEU|nr:PH domain-containing protein [Actinomycetospora cinnamomea]PVZ11788.1 PH (Pleckstrin Homology) domain-containing protein [Actinomycetospora cinnamomea]
MTAPGEPVDIGEVELEVRPVRIRWVAWVLAVFVFALFLTGALLVYVENSGFNFRFADQVAMVVLGAILAGCALLFTRPRLRAGPGGVEVRATILTRRLPWSEVLAVSFPDGTQFARLELPDDEYLTVSALQAVDRGHAARGVSALRRLHARHHRVDADSRADSPSDSPSDSPGR